MNDLAGADLRGATLAGVDIAWTNLTCALLTGAKLVKADLTGANLTRAKLAGANLTGAKLAGARMFDADLTGTKLAVYQVERYTAYVQPDVVTIGCSRFPIELWKKMTVEDVTFRYGEVAGELFGKQKTIIAAIAASLGGKNE